MTYLCTLAARPSACPETGRSRNGNDPSRRACDTTVGLARALWAHEALAAAIIIGVVDGYIRLPARARSRWNRLPEAS
jgi:hypothetical protein